jgi:hypothetical protein
MEEPVSKIGTQAISPSYVKRQANCAATGIL